MKIDSILNTNFNNKRITNNQSCQNPVLNSYSQNLSNISFKGIDEDFIDTLELHFKRYKLPDYDGALDKLYDAYCYEPLLNSRNKNLEIYNSEILSDETIMTAYEKFKAFLKKYLKMEPKEYLGIADDDWLKQHEDNPMHVFLHSLEKIRTEGIRELNNGDGKTYELWGLGTLDTFDDTPDGIGVVCPDKQMGEDFLDCVEFFSKFRGLEESIDYLEYNPYENVFKTDFVTCTIKPEQSLDDLEEVFIDGLNDGLERFKTLGRKTLLHVKDMQDLINPDKVSAPEIAMMKDYMQCSVEDIRQYIL